MDKDYYCAFDLNKFGPFGLLVILTASLALLTVPGTFGAVVSLASFSPQQAATGAVAVTVMDCGGNRIANAVVQVQGLYWSQWKYTGYDGVATIIVPVGTYTVQGGYGVYHFSEPITVGTAGVALTVNTGANCVTTTTTS